MAKEFLNIQVLRGIAALIVVFHHLQMNMLTYYGITPDLNFGAFGVDIFFVISGFVMYYSNAAMSRPITQFLLGRFFRIVPLYWLATLFVVALCLLGFRPLGYGHLSIDNILESLLFIMTTFADGHYELIIFVGWTLIYELFFYAMFAMTLGVMNSILSLATLTGVFLVLVMGNALLDGIPRGLAYVCNPIVFEFIFGGALAIYAIQWQKGPSKASVVSAIAAGAAIILGTIAVVYMDIAGYPSPENYRIFIWGIPAAMIVAGAVVLELGGLSLKFRSALAIGAASYALYLFHPVIMQAVMKLMSSKLPLQGVAGVIVGGSVAVTASIIFAVLVNLTVERKVLAFGKLVSKKLRPSVLA